MSIPFNHPETNPGEMFFSNAHKGDFDKLKYISKRLGTTAYDGEGNRLDTDDWLPIFILKKEIKKTGQSLSELRRDWWGKIEKNS